MKKVFAKPVLRRYDLRVKEEIVGSWRPTPGDASFNFTFIYKDSTGSTITNFEGCFDYLDHYYETAGHMSDADTFLIWYGKVLEEQIGNGTSSPYTAYISSCRGKNGTTSS